MSIAEHTDTAAALREDAAIVSRGATASEAKSEPAGPAARRARSARHAKAWAVAARYGMAVVSVGLALLGTTFVARLVANSISPLFFLAVMVSAWYGGLGPGLLATALAAWASAYFFLGPPESILIGFDDVLRLVVFLAVAVLVSWLTAMRRAAEAALRRAQVQLEHRVRARTAELRDTNASLRTQIDQRRRAETALRQAEERFRLMIEQVEEHAIFMLDADGRVASWNPGAARITGYAGDEIAGRHARCLFPPDARARDDADDHLRVAASAGRVAVEGWRVRRDGQAFWADEVVTALRDESGALRGFAVVLRDATQRRNLEQAVLHVSEREQRRIGHDLHDGLGQQLTGLAFRSKTLEHSLKSAHPADAEEANRLTRLINDAIGHVRDLARGLAPVDVGSGGLVPALRELAERSGELLDLKCHVEVEPAAAAAAASCLAQVEPSSADAGGRTAGAGDAAVAHLYRLTQEAISNAVRHGCAGEVVIRLAGDARRMTLTIADDGAGIADEALAGVVRGPAAGALRPRGMGLRIMQFRARMVGGTLDVRRLEPRGTAVTCTWSLPVPQASALPGDVAVDRPARATFTETGGRGE